MKKNIFGSFSFFNGNFASFRGSKEMLEQQYNKDRVLLMLVQGQLKQDKN